MILSDAEVQHAIDRVQAAFPAFSEWTYHNAKDEEYFGFALWGCFQPNPEVLMPRTFFITLDTYEQQWSGHLTIGQHAYLWSSADMGDAHLVDSDPCDSVEGAIASLKSEMRKGVAESVYEIVSESLEALSSIRRNHSVIQQRQKAV